MRSAPIRVAYQSFGQIEGMEAYQSRLEQLITANADSHTTVQVQRLDSTLTAGKGFSAAQALDVPALLQSIDRAIQQGAEAIAIGNGFDPGLWEARELFDVPVVGMFETLSLQAMRVGWRIGVLCSGASGVARIEELSARYGIASRFVRPHALDVPVPEIVRAFGDTALANDIKAGAEREIAGLRSHGAEVVIVASGALDVLLSTVDVRPADLVLLPSVPVLVAEVEHAASLAQRGIRPVSRAGRFRSPPESVRNALRSATGPGPVGQG